MQLHANAKTTPAARDLLVQRILRDQWARSAAATAAGVSKRTAAKWLARYRAEGVEGLRDRGSRPHHQPRATAVRTIAAILRLRQLGWPAWRIARRVGRPRATVAVILRRAGLGRQRASRPPVRRYEWPAAGDLLHLDIKPLGRFWQAGHRVHGDRRRCSRHAGWEYVHVAVDDATRVAFVEVLARQDGETTAGFLAHAVAWFAAQGITIRRVLSDNGSGYRSHVFRRACEGHGIAAWRTRPYTPRTNGKAERFIQTLQREWAYARAYRTSAQRLTYLGGWVEYYNRQRPHASLEYQAPWARLRAA